MEKRCVKVAPYILDIADAGGEMQEAIFAIDNKNVLKLDNNEATISPSPMVIKALAQISQEQRLNIEPDMNSRRLRRKISHYTGANYDSIACFSSKTSAIETLAKTYLANDLEALISWPAEPMLNDICLATGARVIKTNYADMFRPTVEQIVEQVGSKTRLIYVGNPGNSTGAHFNEAEIVFLLSYAENSLVIVDESYYEFSGLTVVDLTRKFTNLAVIRSLDKAFALTGMPTSYIITDPQNLKYINRLGQYAHPNIPAQTAAEAALNDLSYMVDYIRQVNRSKKILFDNLQRMGYDFIITAANFVLIRTNNSQNLTKELTRNNIYVCDLSDTPEMTGFIRMAIGTPSQTEAVLDILGRLSKDYAAKLSRSLSDIINTDKVVVREKISILTH